MTRTSAIWYERARRAHRLINVRGSMVIDGSFRGSIPLNRSKRWTPYKAREMSPSAEPVR